MTGNDYTPLNFVDPLSGKAVGWEYEAVDEICRRLNCEVDWQVTSWDTMIAAVQEGQFDMGMDGITITDERKQQVDFSDPYMTSQQFMLVRADEDRFATPEEFAANPDLLIGSQIRHHQLLHRRLRRAGRRRSQPAHQAVREFRRGRAGADRRGCGHGADGCGFQPRLHRRQPGQAQDHWRPAGHRRVRFHLHPQIRPGSAFNAAIQTMKDDGFLEQLNTRWFFLYDPTAQ